MPHIALIPAAGIGSRYGAATPKQYAPLLGTPMMQHTLNLFAANPRIAHIAVIIAPADHWFAQAITLPPNASVHPQGGDTRAHSIANGIAHLLNQQLIQPNDTLLVHDAARCCLPQSALNRLLDTLDNDPRAQQHGALLALPVADTLKRQTASRPPRRAPPRPRAGRGPAPTPPAFQAALLHRALSQSNLTQITDDASAVEQLGLQPTLVMGDSRNIKLTRPDDAALAEYFLQQAA